MNGSAAASEEVRLPRQPGVIRRVMAEHPRAVDVTIAVWFVIGSAFGAFLNALAYASSDDGGIALPPNLEWPWWPVALARVAVITTALLLRRTYPLEGLIATLLASLGDYEMQTLANWVAISFFVYAVPVYRSVRAGWIGFVSAVVIEVAGNWVNPLLVRVMGFTDAAAGSEPVAIDIRELTLVFIMSVVWYLAVVMLGINLGNRRRYLAAIIDRAHQLARERDQLARLAVAEERARIAREMHDIVAHSVTVMIALSEGAARAVEAAPDAARDALERSAETGRTALAEMRRLLGGLGGSADRSGELEPQPGTADLPGLVEQFREAGLNVQMRISGEAAGDRGQDLAVYRTVQEGLTNALRHAGSGARVQVAIVREPTSTLVEVHDFGGTQGRSPSLGNIGAGRGLAGLRERARMLGGGLEAGPAVDYGRDTGGWILRAELPVDSLARAERDDGTDPQGGRETRRRQT